MPSLFALSGLFSLLIAGPALADPGAPTLTATPVQGGLLLEVEDAVPDGRLAILGGAGIGGEYLTAGPCFGEWVALSGPLVLMDGVQDLDEDGAWWMVVEDRIPHDIGGLMALDLETCETSEVLTSWRAGGVATPPLGYTSPEAAVVIWIDLGMPND